MEKIVNLVIQLWYTCSPFYSQNINEFIAMAKKEHFERIAVRGGDVVVCMGKNSEGRIIIYRENCLKGGKVIQPEEIIEKLIRQLSETRIIGYGKIFGTYAIV